MFLMIQSMKSKKSSILNLGGRYTIKPSMHSVTREGTPGGEKQHLLGQVLFLSYVHRMEKLHHESPLCHMAVCQNLVPL